MSGNRTRPSTPVSCDCGLGHRHGTRRMYALHLCGCFACRVANANAARVYRSGGSVREREVDATGTKRRLRALAAAGVSAREVAAALGVTKEAVQELRSDRRGSVVYAATAERVAAVYERLWNRPVRSGYAERTRREALARGWHPPMAWDDDSIDNPEAQPSALDDTGDVDEFEIELLMAGERRVAKWARSAERDEAVRRMAARGMTDPEIGLRLLMTGAAVLKVRERNDIPAGVPSTRRSRGIRGAA